MPLNVIFYFDIPVYVLVVCYVKRRLETTSGEQRFYSRGNHSHGRYIDFKAPQSQKPHLAAKRGRAAFTFFADILYARIEY